LGDFRVLILGCSLLRDFVRQIFLGGIDVLSWL